MVAEIFVWLGGDQEIARNNIGSLVEQLEKGVLAVAARLAPELVAMSDWLGLGDTKVMRRGNLADQLAKRV